MTRLRAVHDPAQVVSELETGYIQRHAPTRIISDFPVTVTGTDRETQRRYPTRYVRAHVRLGDGHHHVRVSTMHGNVRIVRVGRGGAPR